MSRETIEEKGRRYLTEGRVRVYLAGAKQVRAAVFGSEVYWVGYDAEVWSCDCPARGRCAHLIAVGLVTPRSAA